MEVAAQSQFELPQQPGSSTSAVSTPPQTPPEQDRSPSNSVQQQAPLLFNGASASVAPAQGKPGTDATAAKKPRPRKKKDDQPGTAANNGDKPTKERKPRKPKDPNAPPRKRQKKTEEDTTANGGQQTLTSSFGVPVSAAPPSAMSAPQQNQEASTAPGFTQTGKNEVPNKVTGSALHPTVLSQPPARPQSSGQRYDPIRSASAENARIAESVSPNRPVALQNPTHARASPAIASLIDPPDTNPPPRPVTSIPRPPEAENAPKPQTQSPVIPDTSISNASNHFVTQPPVASTGGSGGTERPPGADVEGLLKAKPLNKSSKSNTPSRVPSPKPARKKQEMPPLPLGSGLLSSAAFGKTSTSEREFAEVPNQCIVIDVPITGETGNYVNFMKEVENKYGFDVAHPRVAEHRRRMAQIAAAGAAIESGVASADEMALDMSDADSNVEMGGVDEESTAAEGATATIKKKRRTKANEYDKTDDFIDDTEQAWQEQALASRDGYFVWSGPLVAEGDKPAVERADGTTKRGGRGSRGGRGGTSRSEGSTRGRGTTSRRGTTSGRGSRGGSTMRKPRITKADREEREAEKAEREKMAANLASSATPTKTAQVPGAPES